MEVLGPVSEWLGVLAFAASGAMVGIRHRLDLFGVLMLGMVTALGGGVIRDMLLGIHPPKTFVRPVYALVSASFSLLAFVIEYHHAKRHTPGEFLGGSAICLLSTGICAAVCLMTGLLP